MVGPGDGDRRSVSPEPPTNTPWSGPRVARQAVLSRSCDISVGYLLSDVAMKIEAARFLLEIGPIPRSL